ncbi:transporter substrate-binding domain-containing protein [Mycobacterium sp. CVI_P3]|uniref:Transporter substrate-binding domain-containing protein n=1 Tax=Mycobacterium pinniadriaticum TaxID=2994102 RepID=A0ABT3SDF1_9MYCO|nr:transporter substrate-binding domain-containing protein [Mycobacterium pinniadriaticum]MCX2930516.1 transporter substrate-binding domain-containing protein [Mycobacterium pinniadriaticum]MCX2936940.1 transporter substrate-binding domain-containing protein [Mycobacterium pinniadriaticum]
MAPTVAPRAGAQPGSDSDPRQVTVAVHTLEPFVMKTKAGEWTGFSIDLWTEIANRLGWSTEYLDTGDVRGQLAAVTDDRADLAVGAISLTAQREQSFDFSQPTLDAGLQIMVPVHHTRASVPGLGGYLDLLFSRTMLIWLSAAIVVSVIPAHVFWLIERRSANPVVARSYFPGIVQAFGWGIGSLVGKNSRLPTRVTTRALAILWGFAGIVFVSFYSANLSATLTVAKLESKIAGPADLYGKSVATVADTTAASYLRDMGIDATETRTIDDCYHLLETEGYDAVVFDAPVLRYYAAHRGEGVAALAGPVFQDESQGYVFAINSPLRKPINQTLFRMREDGTYNLIKEKWFGDDEAVSANNPN